MCVCVGRCGCAWMCMGVLCVVLWVGKWVFVHVVCGVVGGYGMLWVCCGWVSGWVGGCLLHVVVLYLIFRNCPKLNLL